MNDLQKHRGPDGAGVWIHPRQHVGFAHRRLSIIDHAGGAQPMGGPASSSITFNGEIYNYKELRSELGASNFKSESDTEVILHSFARWGTACVDRLRGMFSFAIWDEQNQRIFCARDRVGIKPFYYSLVDGLLYFASEAKALLPFIHRIEADTAALKDYLCFQLCLEGKTLFRGVNELRPGHRMIVKGSVHEQRYWDCKYSEDTEHSENRLADHLRAILQDSIRLHARSDVPMGGYVSGGLDSSIVAAYMRKEVGETFVGFTGKFGEGKAYDESPYARSLASSLGFDLHEVTIRSTDFIDLIESVAFHMDFPVAGPGSFNQYVVSREAAKLRKVMVGGQGGDEIFGGYARYLVAFLGQALKRSIAGNPADSDPTSDLAKILPQLPALSAYKPMIREFLAHGLFDDEDQQYLRLVNRSADLSREIRWEELGTYSPLATAKQIYNSQNVAHRPALDRMAHFDFKTLLPALLQVEDRVSMAHGIESRVPLLDHRLIEFAASLPQAYKYRDGIMKAPLRDVGRDLLPDDIMSRRDKMGFPIPLAEWLVGDLGSFVQDIFASSGARQRGFWNHSSVVAALNDGSSFGRRAWGFLSLELWHRTFIDRASEFKSLLKQRRSTVSHELRDQGSC